MSNSSISTSVPCKLAVKLQRIERTNSLIMARASWACYCTLNCASQIWDVSSYILDRRCRIVVGLAPLEEKKSGEKRKGNLQSGVLCKGGHMVMSSLIWVIIVFSIVRGRKTRRY